MPSSQPAGARQKVKRDARHATSITQRTDPATIAPSNRRPPTCPPTLGPHAAQAMTTGGPMTSPLGVADTIAVLRERYPDGLVCIACGRLLATRRESWSARLSDPARLEHVCAECRQARAEADRIQAVRLEVAQRASQAAAEVRRKRARNGADVDQNSRPGSCPRSDGEAIAIPSVYAGMRDGFRLRSKGHGGRPRKHRDDRARLTAAQRAWRARQKATVGA